MNPEVPQKEINPLKSEHLKEDVQPIIACTMSDVEFEESLNDFVEQFGDSTETVNVKYGEGGNELVKQGFKIIEYGLSVISPIDDRNKMSFEYANCIGVVAVGVDKETGKNISFQTHQNLRSFGQFKKSTIRDLVGSLNKLKSKCVEETIDIVIVGGCYTTKVIEMNGRTRRDTSGQDDYAESINFISEQVKSVFGFEPVVLSGPKMFNGTEKIFFDNENRRLYSIRPESVNKGVTPFTPNKIDEEKPKWQPDDVKTGIDF